ncbi:hypothetical protein GGR53DRAFT_465139 [Hypoxylon sp. FL1150]|nr:hypothetical protein GGR53DRAFT_465139 [Hypoxylon sp. FL1150]
MVMNLPKAQIQGLRKCKSECIQSPTDGVVTGVVRISFRVLLQYGDDYHSAAHPHVLRRTFAPNLSNKKMGTQAKPKSTIPTPTVAKFAAPGQHSPQHGRLNISRHVAVAATVFSNINSRAISAICKSAASSPCSCATSRAEEAPDVIERDDGARPMAGCMTAIQRLAANDDALKTARTANIPFLATGGHHGYGTTLGNLRNGLAIGLRLLKSFGIDMTPSIITVGAGTLAGDSIGPVYEAGYELGKFCRLPLSLRQYSDRPKLPVSAWNGPESESRKALAPFFDLNPPAVRVSMTSYTKVSSVIIFGMVPALGTPGSHHDIFTVDVRKLDAVTFISAFEKLDAVFQGSPGWSI